MSSQPRARILIVDDEPMNLEIFVNLLAAENDLRFATSGREACKLALQEPPDLILLDVVMPGMNGHETCRQLKAHPLLANVPIIFVTTTKEAEDETEGLALGAADYITKPINAAITRLRIRNLLERSRLHSELEASLVTLREREDRLKTLIASMQDVVLVMDAEGVISECHLPTPSPLLAEQTTMIHYREVFPQELSRELAGGFARISCDGQAFSCEGEWPRAGQSYYCQVTVSQLADSRQSPAEFLVVIRDLSARWRAEEEVRRLAFFDPLTKLPNRRLLMDRLAQALAWSHRFQRFGALLFIDMDNFKHINDTLGHDVGDALLVEVAERLAACVRECDTVARLGGDEFVVMLQDVDTQPEETIGKVELMGGRILELLNQPYQLSPHLCRSTPSIGATLFRDKSESLEVLLKRADLAMYQVKKSGRNGLRFFAPAMLPESACASS